VSTPSQHTPHPTDEELIAAIHRGIWDGSLVEVTPQWLEQFRAQLDAQDAPE